MLILSIDCNDYTTTDDDYILHCIKIILWRCPVCFAVGDFYMCNSINRVTKQETTCSSSDEEK